MGRVVVLSTGGTIASRTDPTGVTCAQDSAATLLASSTAPPGVELVGVDVERVGSYALSPAQMVHLAGRAAAALADPSVVGVVVTHGTDTLEASAAVVQLLVAPERPVVFTGAMRAADVPDSDGPRNLADAIAVAASPTARGLGVLVVMDGVAHAAIGVRKVHTSRTAAFASPDAGALGDVTGGRLVLHRAPDPDLPARLAATGLVGARVDASSARVDLVASYPGADGALLRAAADAGARGVVLEGTGAGNTTPALCAEVAAVVARGVVVALSTRVHAGPVAAVYGGGGGADLVAAGAVPLTWLRGQQALVLLTCLLADRDAAGARAALGLW